MTDITNKRIEDNDVVLAIYKGNVFTAIAKNEKLYSITKGETELIELDPEFCTFIVILPDNKVYSVKEDLDKIRRKL